MFNGTLLSSRAHIQSDMLSGETHLPKGASFSSTGVSIAWMYESVGYSMSSGITVSSGCISPQWGRPALCSLGYSRAYLVAQTGVDPPAILICQSAGC